MDTPAVGHFMTRRAIATQSYWDSREFPERTITSCWQSGYQTTENLTLLLQSPRLPKEENVKQGLWELCNDASKVTQQSSDARFPDLGWNGREKSII
jgi:hypothetical protein